MTKARRTWLIATLFVISQFALPKAFAALTATSTSSLAQTYSTASWGITPVATDTSSNTSAAYVMNAILKSNNKAGGTYFSVRNFGSIQTLSMTIIQTTTGTGTYTVPVQACSGVWTESTGACSGTITTIFTNTNASTNSGILTFTLAPSAAKRLRVNYSASGNLTINSSISVSVSSANLRAPISTSG